MEGEWVNGTHLAKVVKYNQKHQRSYNLKDVEMSKEMQIKSLLNTIKELADVVSDMIKDEEGNHAIRQLDFDVRTAYDRTEIGWRSSSDHC